MTVSDCVCIYYCALRGGWVDEIVGASTSDGALGSHFSNQRQLSSLSEFVMSLKDQIAPIIYEVEDSGGFFFFSQPKW